MRFRSANTSFLAKRRLSRNRLHMKQEKVQPEEPENRRRKDLKESRCSCTTRAARKMKLMHPPGKGISHTGWFDLRGQTRRFVVLELREMKIHIVTSTSQLTACAVLRLPNRKHLSPRRHCLDLP